MVVATFVVAPLPNALCSRYANNDDFIDSSGSGILDLGRFLTGFLVVMGIGMFGNTSFLFLFAGGVSFAIERIKKGRIKTLKD